MQKQGGSNQETVVQSWGRVLVPPQGTHITTSLSSAGAKAPTQMEDSNFRLSTGFLEHLPLASLPNQSEESCTYCSPHPTVYLPFLRTSGDHPVRSPVWPLSVSSLDRVQQFQAKLLLLQGWKPVSDTEYLN